MLLSTRKSIISLRFVTIKFVIVISLRLGYSLDVFNMILEIYVYVYLVLWHSTSDVSDAS